MPSFQVSRKALTCSGSREMSALFAVLDVPRLMKTCQLRIELNAIGRVEINALHLSAQALAFGQAGHDRKEGIP